MIVDFETHPIKIELHAAPCFQSLERVTGTMDDITKKIDELKLEESNAWLEIEYRGKNIAADLRGVFDQSVAESDMEILRIKNQRIVKDLMLKAKEEQTLDDLNEIEVFTRLLDSYEVMKDERSSLIQAYNEIITSLHEMDTNAL